LRIIGAKYLLRIEWGLRLSCGYMFDHLGIFATSPEKSIPFLEACLEPLGIKVRERLPEIGAVIFYGEKEFPFLFVGPAKGSYYGTELEKLGYKPMHLASVAPSRDAVDEFYRRGLVNGGRDNGAPEDDGSGYYAAFLLDPDGNNIEAGIRK
jgi:catechol 2,3-dioxygenase-like lactoylglutathione lyase family enzyme